MEQKSPSVIQATKCHFLQSQEPEGINSEAVMS